MLLLLTFCELTRLTATSVVSDDFPKREWTPSTDFLEDKKTKNSLLLNIFRGSEFLQYLGEL